jgi:ketosteroid isomerase-like protein
LGVGTLISQRLSPNSHLPTPNSQLMTILTALLAISLAAPLGAQTALRREVETLFADMTAAFKISPASVAKFYTDDAMIAGGRLRVTGREAVDKYWNGVSGFTDWKLELIDIGEGTVPWVRGVSTLVGAEGRNSVTEFLGLLKRGADGKLRFYVDMYIPAAPPPPPAARPPEPPHHGNSGWKELDVYHALMAATWHPARSNDLKPIRAKADSLASMARLWSQARVPAACDTQPVKDAIAAVAAGSMHLAELVRKNVADAELKSALHDVHERFEVVEKRCKPGKSHH